MDEKEVDSTYKLSRVDLEVEKLKLQADLEVGSNNQKDFDEDESYLMPSDEDVDFRPLSDYESQEELYQIIIDNWDDLAEGDYYTHIGTFQALDDDKKKMDLAERYAIDEHWDPVFLSAIVSSLHDDSLKRDYITKIDEIVMSPDALKEHTIIRAVENANRSREYNKNFTRPPYSKEECQKFMRDRCVSNIVVTLHNPDEMMSYYKDMDDLSARQLILDAIKNNFPEYQSELTLDELQEVSTRMGEEVAKVEEANKKTRGMVEKEIQESLKRLKETKKEYIMLTKREREKDEYSN